MYLLNILNISHISLFALQFRIYDSLTDTYIFLMSLVSEIYIAAKAFKSTIQSLLRLKFYLFKILFILLMYMYMF